MVINALQIKVCMYETLARIRVSYHSAEQVLTAAVLEHGLHNITHESPGAWINGI